LVVVEADVTPLRFPVAICIKEVQLYGQREPLQIFLELRHKFFLHELRQWQRRTLGGLQLLVIQQRGAMGAHLTVLLMLLVIILPSVTIGENAVFYIRMFDIVGDESFIVVKAYKAEGPTSLDIWPYCVLHKHGDVIDPKLMIRFFLQSSELHASVVIRYTLCRAHTVLVNEVVERTNLLHHLNIVHIDMLWELVGPASILDWWMSCPFVIYRT
jgi:hypothetical protein